MKKILLVLLFIAFGTQAQTTHDLNWYIGIGTSVDLNIKVGDIVRWTWTDDAPHTVTSSPGSTETFDSGEITGNGMTWSKPFTEVGINPYECIIHPATMKGTITVEDALDVDEFSIQNFSITPNPASTEISLKLPNNIKIENIRLYNMMGQEIHETKSTKEPIDISNLTPGMYFLKINSLYSYHTKRFVKL